MNVKINGKNYVVPQLGFKEMTDMESIADGSILTIFQKRQIFLLSAAFVGCVVGCDRDEASRLCEQHILGGGKIEDIYKAFNDAANESGFFKKLLGLEEEKKTKKSSNSQTMEE